MSRFERDGVRNEPDSCASEIGMRVAVVSVRPLASSKLLRCVGVFAACSSLAGCSANVGTFDADRVSDAGALEVCDGQTLADLANAKTISDGCKHALQAYLPRPFDDFDGRVVVLGRETHDDGSVRLFVAAVDAAGSPLSNDALATATVAPKGGAVAADVSVAVGVTPFASLPEDVLSLELVNDYSASMSVPDLKVVQRIQDDLLNALPPFYEGEVTLFSSAVRVKQAFTTDHASLLAGVECDQAFDRELTALYDGMGNGLQSLTSRARPARVLMVSTDGLENASVAFKKTDILQRVAQDHVFVVMLGALFADFDELSALAGPNGVYFYTPLYPDLRARVSKLVNALSHGAAVDIPASMANQGPLVLDIAGQSVEVESD
jgi:hypothetical protein